MAKMVKKETPTAPAKGRTPSSRRGLKRSTPVRVWSEASITVAVTSDPPQFVKFTHGFEMMSPSDTQEDIKKTELRIYKACEEIVDKRSRKLARLVRRMNV